MITFEQFQEVVARVEGSYRHMADDPTPEWTFENSRRPLFPSVPAYRAQLLDNGDQTIISYYESGTWWLTSTFSPTCSLMSNGNSLAATIQAHKRKVLNLSNNISSIMEEGQSIPPYLRTDCLTLHTFQKAVSDHAKGMNWGFQETGRGNFTASYTVDKSGSTTIVVEHAANGVNADWTVTVDGLTWGYGNCFLAAWEMARKNGKESRTRLQLYRIHLQ